MMQSNQAFTSHIFLRPFFHQTDKKSFHKFNAKKYYPINELIQTEISNIKYFLQILFERFVWPNLIPFRNKVFFFWQLNVNIDYRKSCLMNTIPASLKSTER